MLDNLWEIIAVFVAIFGAVFAAFRYYFKPRLQKSRGKLILRSLLYSFCTTLLLLIAYYTGAQLHNQLTNQIKPFKEKNVGILILPFDPLEDYTAKEEDMAKKYLSKKCQQKTRWCHIGAIGFLKVKCSP